MHSKEYYYIVGGIVQEKAPGTSAGAKLKTPGDYYNITTIVYRKVHCHTCDESVDVKFHVFKSCCRFISSLSIITTARSQLWS